MKPYLSLALALTLLGCGGSDSSPTLVSTSNPSEPSRADIVSHSQGTCTGGRLAQIGTWQVQPYQSDTIIVGEDCYFKTFYCGAEGYVNSNIATNAVVGMADIVIVYVAHPQNSGCLSLGAHSCQYQDGDAQFQNIYLTCQ